MGRALILLLVFGLITLHPGDAAAQNRRAPRLTSPLHKLKKLRRRVPIKAMRGFDSAMAQLDRPAPSTLRVGPGQSLAAAVARLTQGGTIEIRGLVRTNTVIERPGKSFKIVGVTNDAALVGASSSKPVLEVKVARAVQVSKLTIRNGSVGVLATGDTYLRLRDLKIRDNGVGLRVNSPGGKLVELTDSTVNRNRESGVAATGATLFVASTQVSRNPVNLLARQPRFLLLHRARVLNSPRGVPPAGMRRKRVYPNAGAIIHGGTTVVVDESTFAGNGGIAGLMLDRVRGGEISDTRFESNKGSGLIVRDSSSIVVKNSHLLDNGDFGASLHNTSIALTRVTASRNVRANIMASRGSVRLVDSKIERARQDHTGAYGFGYLATDGGSHRFVRSKFLHNPLAGISIQRESCSNETSPCHVSLTRCEVGYSPFGFHGHTCGGRLDQISFHDIKHDNYASGSQVCPSPPPSLPAGL